MIRSSLLTMAVCLGLPVWASGQEPLDAPARARIRLGPLALAPSIALADLGVDSNVFYDAENPREDFTATVTSRVEAWLRLGRARVTGKSDADLVYFKHYDTERSINTRNEIRADLPINRLTPYAAASLLNSRQRPDFEIDARSRRIEHAVSFGTEARMTGKTKLGGAVHRSRINFDADAVFLGTNLRNVLNRDIHRLTGSFRYDLTPLTTVVVTTDRQIDRFEFEPERDAKSLRIMPGFEFGSFAVITGRAFVGYRQLNFEARETPDFSGLVASVDLGYTLLGRTRFAAQAERDALFSFETGEAYYVLTGINGTVTQSLSTTWDVVGRIGRQRLNYQHDRPVTPGTVPRIDHVWTYGGGIGYRLGRTVRVGVNVDQYRRRSVIYGRDYEGLRIGSSVTYGF